MGLGALLRRNEPPDCLRTKSPDEVAFVGRGGPPIPVAPGAADEPDAPAPGPKAEVDEAPGADPDDNPVLADDKLVAVEGMTGEACSAIFFSLSARLV
jgi:hypothetical protein